MKKYLLLAFTFLAILLFVQGCHTPMSFNEAEVEQIEVGVKTLRLNAVIGRGDSKESTLKAPISMVVDPKGNIYIVDDKKRGLFQYSPSGSFLQRIRLDKASEGAFYPMNVEMDPEGNIILMDAHAKRRERKRIHFISKMGTLSRTKPIPGHFSDLIFCKDALFFTTYDINQTKLIVKMPLSGEILTEFGEMSGDNPELHYINNQVSLCSDGKENIILSYTYLPKISIFTPDGTLIREFEYEAAIKNKKAPLNIIRPLAPTKMEGAHGIAELTIETYPVCYDIAVQGQESIFLLMAVNHSRSSERALFHFDYSGRLLEKALLPFSCHKLCIDDHGNIYFIGAVGGKYILKFKGKREG